MFPDEETWARLDPAERQRVIDRILDTLDEYREAMSEGVRHQRRKTGIAAELDGHFRRAGRAVFIASELAVLYPGEPAIVPDVLAVMDCDPDIEPETWVVSEQGRGVDVVVEVRNLGKKHKDLVENVRDYARRRIPEYFSFNCRDGQLRGWRLAELDALTYQPSVPQGGYLRSAVLGLELAAVGTRLRFYANQALVPDASEIVARLQAMADQQQSQLDEAARERDDARRERDDVRGQLHAAQVAMSAAILTLCEARGVALSPDQHAAVVAEGDVARLTRWLTAAATASDGDAIFAA
ncbi:MAG: Uma2 family endonuclease [Polyangiales bacterium]